MIDMARLIRPLRQWPIPLHSTFIHIDYTPSSATSHHHNRHRVSYSTLPSSQSQRHVHRGLKLPNTPVPSISNDDEASSGSDSDTKMSRNQKKRLAKHAVRWGMDLAFFSPPQINRILKAASLEREVFEAIMTVKRLRPDVREGKRRQFNYIGKLLREVEPQLMDTLIQATKDGDHNTLQALVGVETSIIADENDDVEFEETDSEDDAGSSEYINVATRWFDGLINRDIEITKEVYAVNSVDFDRQELRKLVRNVHAVLEEKDEEKVNAAMTSAKKSLTRFLRYLAKQTSTE